MKLNYSSTSPYVRKVSVTAIECGLQEQIERVMTNPWDPQTELHLTNPLCKVPALTLENGQVLFDSPVICEYLDSLGEPPRLVPAAGEQRWQALRMQALGDGILDAAVGRILESRRPEELQSLNVAERHISAVSRALDMLESQADALGSGFGIGEITIAVALEYLDFRFSVDNWRKGRPDLAQWHESVASRPSLTATKPHD